jgi:glucose/mannose transport system permease protein
MTHRISRAGVYALLVLLSVFFLLPVYVVVVTSLKPVQEATLANMWSLPGILDTQSYLIAFEKLSPHLLNSLYLAVPATILSALLGSLNGYVLSKWRFRGDQALFTAILFGMFIPYQSILIPLIQFLQKIQLYNTIPGLILVHVVYGIPITTLIFRNFYGAIPGEIIESAQIDGCGIWSAYRRIILPLSVPGFVVTGIWQFTQIWNEFLFAVTITNTAQQPVMVALQNLSGSQIVQWNVQMAGALLAALPTLLVYIFLGRYFIRGLLAGALKG